MPWKECVDYDPTESCVACGYSGGNLKIFEQIQGDLIFGKEFIKWCNECGCLNAFYLDPQTDLYFYQNYRIVELDAYDELRANSKPS